MKKAFLIGAVLTVCAFAFTGAALAAEISTSGTIEFKLTGTTEEGGVSGLFAAGDVLVDYSVTLTSDAWEANLTPEFDLAGEALTFDDAYIKYSLDMLAVTMKPLGIRKKLWDIRGMSDTKIRLPNNPGIDVEVPIAPLTLDLVVNNQAVVDEAKFNYAVGGKYEADPITVEAIYGISNVETYEWYGSYYGAKVSAALDSLTLEGQYGAFSPEAAGLEDGSGYFGKAAYALGEGLGTFTVKYTGADEHLNRTAENWAKIYGEYSHPLTDDVTLKLDVTNITPGTGEDSYTEYEALIGVSL